MTNQTPNSVIISGVEYVPANSPMLAKDETTGLPYVIIRTYSAGVHMGYLKAKESTLAGMEVELINTRRLYKWAGALTISELAAIGTNNPQGCQFTMEIPSITLVAIEIVPVTQVGFSSLTSVPVWTL
jgi:hypothetical protein